ncbi:MAG: ArsC family reductase [Pseudomonadota bacterium]
MKLFGIPNCDTVKKARAWLENHRVAYEFHDLKKEPALRPLLQGWIRQGGWEMLLNRQGITWRNLDDAVKAALTNQAAALALMLEKPTVIKRPLLELDGKLRCIGYDEAVYTQLFKAKK